jgi:hypothetical protein
MGAGGTLSQTLGPGAGWGELIQTGTTLSAAVMLQVVSGQVNIKAKLMYGSSPVGVATSKDIGPESELKPYTMMFNVADATDVDSLQLTIVATGATVIRIAGAWLGFGPSPEIPLGTLDYSYLPRTGGDVAAMRGDLVLGNHDALWRNRGRSHCPLRHGSGK